MKYSTYTSEDFICNESFLNYYFNLNESDKSFWENWTIDHPEKTHEVNSALETLKLLSLNLPSDEYKLGLESIKKYIQYNSDNQKTSLFVSIKESFQNKRLNKKTVISGLLVFRKIAASVAIILGIGAAFFYSNYSTQNDHNEPLISLVEKANPKGQKSTIFLNDGSKIVLNSSSKISYPETFGSKERVLKLEGEAFFDIANDKKRPFIIQTGKIFTTALGTSFNIKSTLLSDKIKVSLLTGSVRVELRDNGSSAEEILVPGDQITFSTTDKELRKHSFKSEEILAWKDGIIYFKDATVKEIISELENWYGVQFEVKNKPEKDNYFSGEFNNQSLENVLTSLSFSKGFKYKIKDKKIIINFKP